MSSVVFFILTTHGITGQRARDKERQQKADRTEGGQRKREQTESRPAAENGDKKIQTKKKEKCVKMTAPKTS